MFNFLTNYPSFSQWEHLFSKANLSGISQNSHVTLSQFGSSVPTPVRPWTSLSSSSPRLSCQWFPACSSNLCVLPPAAFVSGNSPNNRQPSARDHILMKHDSSQAPAHESTPGWQTLVQLPFGTCRHLSAIFVSCCTPGSRRHPKFSRRVSR